MKSFNETADYVIKTLGPGEHEIPGNEFATLISNSRGLKNKNHPEYWKPVLAVLKEKLGESNISLPSVFSKKNKVRVFIKEEKEVDLTLEFARLGKNRHGNLLVMTPEDIAKLGLTPDKIISMISSLGVKGATLLPDALGNYNFQRFDLFYNALILNSSTPTWLGDGLGDTPLENDLTALFKSYNSATQKFNPDLITDQIKNFWEITKPLRDINLPTPERPILHDKKNKAVSPKKTWEIIKTELFSYKDIKIDSNRVSDFITMEFLHITRGLSPVKKISIESIDREGISSVIETPAPSFVRIINILQERSDIKLTNININLIENIMTLNVKFMFLSQQELEWITS